MNRQEDLQMSIFRPARDRRPVDLADLDLYKTVPQILIGLVSRNTPA